MKDNIFFGFCFAALIVGLSNNTYAQWSQVDSVIYGEGKTDGSGISIDLSSDGTILAVGAINNDGNGSNAGHVRVYFYNGGIWSQMGGDIDGEAADDKSGNSVSLSSDGSIVAIGAPGNDGNGSFAGHVRVYKYNNGNWIQVGKDIDGENSYDRSGTSVSLSSDGTIVAIGAWGNDGNGNNAGHVRVYENNEGDWKQIGGDIDGEVSSDYSGHSVS